MNSQKELSSCEELYKKLNDDRNFKINWMTVQFDEKNEISFTVSGEGGYDEGRALLKDEPVFLVVRGCNVRRRIVQKIILLLLYIPEKVVGFERARAAFQVGVLSEKLEMGHFCLVDSRKCESLEPEVIIERVKAILGFPGKYIIDETSNTVLEKNFEEEEWKRERPESEKKKETRNNVFKEILETEESYVRSLNLFMNNYIIPLKDIAPDFHRSLVTPVGIIININQEFLQKLRDCIRDDETEGEEEEKKKEEHIRRKMNVAMMVSLLVSQCPVFKLYLPYVNMYSKHLSKAKLLLKENPKFRAFCKRKNLDLVNQKERCTDIFGFLIMPIQRIPRYQLLMRDLLKQTHAMDPNYKKIEEGLKKTQELAQYVNEKKAEADMSVKTIAIAQQYQMDDLIGQKRKMLKCGSCVMKKDQEGQIYVFTDLVLLVWGKSALEDIDDFVSSSSSSGKKKKKKKKKYRKKNLKNVEKISLNDHDIRVYIAEDLESRNRIVVETGRKKVDVNFNNKKEAESFLNIIQKRLSLNLGRKAMSQNLISHVIFQSMLLKCGGGKFSNKKKRWHTVTADLKMTYFDKPGVRGTMKGSYSLMDSIFGKGVAKMGKIASEKIRQTAVLFIGEDISENCSRTDNIGKKKKTTINVLPYSIRQTVAGSMKSNDYGFYITAMKRTYQVFASNIEILDIWIKVLTLIGLRRIDLIDEETEKLQQFELERILATRRQDMKVPKLRKKQAEESAVEEKKKVEEEIKRMKKLNSMLCIINLLSEKEGEDDEKSKQKQQQQMKKKKKKILNKNNKKEKQQNTKEEVDKNKTETLLIRQRQEIAKMKNLMHRELRVRSNSITQSQRLLEKIRNKKKNEKKKKKKIILKPSTIPLKQSPKQKIIEVKKTTIKEEKEEQKQQDDDDEEEEEDEQDFKMTEKVIMKKRDVHTELLMAHTTKKNRNSLLLIPLKKLDYELPEKMKEGMVKLEEYERLEKENQLMKEEVKLLRKKNSWGGKFLGLTYAQLEPLGRASVDREGRAIRTSYFNLKSLIKYLKNLKMKEENLKKKE